MNKKIWSYIVAGVFAALYLADTIWYIVSVTDDNTGWKDIGVVVFSVVMLFPAIIIFGSIIMQILDDKKNILFFPLLNACGLAVFSFAALLAGNNASPVILVIIPAGFLLSLLMSYIVVWTRKIIAKSKS